MQSNLANQCNIYRTFIKLDQTINGYFLLVDLFKMYNIISFLCFPTTIVYISCLRLSGLILLLAFFNRPVMAAERSVKDVVQPNKPCRMSCSDSIADDLDNI